MLAACINFQLGHLLTAHRIAGNHAFNSFLDNSFRKTAGQYLAGCGFFDAADPAGMFEIFLRGQFLAGQLYFVGIDNNDIVAAVQVRNIGCLLYTSDAADE